MLWRDNENEEFGEEFYKALLSDQEIESEDDADKEIKSTGTKTCRELDHAGSRNIIAEDKLPY